MTQDNIGCDSYYASFVGVLFTCMYRKNDRDMRQMCQHHRVDYRTPSYPVLLKYGNGNSESM